MKHHIQAKFIGGDNLMGFQDDNIYRLYVWKERNGAGIVIAREDNDEKTVYSSINTFLENWTTIEHVDLFYGKSNRTK